jgi:hypothetical protein
VRQITQAEYDALPVVRGYRQCPGFTDYSGVRCFGDHARFGAHASFGKCASFGENASFGEHASFGEGARFGAHASFGEWAIFGENASFGKCASFGEGARFGAHASFGEWASFGENASFGKGAKLENTKRLLGSTIYAFGGFGSANRTTYCIPMKSGIYVRCGCWAGSMQDFRRRIADVCGASDIAREYLAICDIAEMRRRRELKTADREGSE